jgi:hypothetical protein
MQLLQSLNKSSSASLAVALSAGAALVMTTPALREASAIALRLFSSIVAHPQVPLALTTSVALKETFSTTAFTGSYDKEKTLLAILAALGLIKVAMNRDEEPELSTTGIKTTIASVAGLAGLTLITSYAKN